jgi:hypothetical protein
MVTIVVVFILILVVFIDLLRFYSFLIKVFMAKKLEKFWLDLSDEIYLFILRKLKMVRLIVI